jgi:E1A/CREB-binding protein
MFETDIDPIMKSLGYCCGQEYGHEPRAIPCYGREQCSVKVGAKYYYNKYK